MSILNNDLIRIAARTVWNGISDIVNVFYTVVEDNNSQTTQAIIDELIEVVEDLYELMSTAYANNVTAADMSIRNLTQNEVYGASPWPNYTGGSNVDQAINPALGVFAYSPTLIPNVQGRKWWGPWTEGNNDDGFWTASLVGGIDTVMSSLQTAWPSSIGLTARPVIAHLKEVDDMTGELVDVVPPVISPYTSSTITNNAGVLTRRRPGSGS